MELYPRGPSLSSRAIGSLLVFGSLAGAVCGLTLLYLGMRSVMEIGGSCGSGGPYEIARPCPSGIPLVMMGGIWGGIIAFFVYLWQVSSRGVAGFAALAWPALFLSLGWNFLDYGLDSPAGGLEWGWLVCAVTFGLMGAAPLALGGRGTLRKILPFGHGRGTNGPGTNGFGANPYRRPLMRIPAANEPIERVPATTFVGFGTADHPDVVHALERLAAVRQAGALTEEEFERAKLRILEDE